MSVAENLQREDLTIFEMIETIVEIVDEELIEDNEYASLCKMPTDRVRTILRKIDSVRRSRERGFNPAKKAKQTSIKFVRRIENIFNNRNISKSYGRKASFHPLVIPAPQPVRDKLQQDT